MTNSQGGNRCLSRWLVESAALSLAIGLSSGAAAQATPPHAGQQAPASTQQTLPARQAQPLADQGAAQDPVSTTEPDDSGEEIVVTGVRRSLEDALNAKRASSEVIDSISSEGIGRLPDLNLAESLQRVPGVQINRSSLRRLGAVSIRGLPGGFLVTQINGQPLSSPNITGFNFGTVRSEAFSRIDVIKAQSADRYSGGIAGIVDLRTGDPLTSAETLVVSVENSYEELQDVFTPGGAVVLSKQIVPGVLGIRLAAGWKRLNFRDDQVQINTYDRTTGGATPADPSDDTLIPRQVRLNTSAVRGDSYTASGTIEWKPTSQLRARLSGFYNNYTPENYNTQFTVEAQNGSTRTQSGLIDSGALGKTFTEVRIDDPFIRVDNRSFEDLFRTMAFTGDLEWSNDDWTVDSVLHFTKAKRGRNSRLYFAQQDPRAGSATSGYSVLVNTGAGRIEDFRFDLLQPRPLVLNFEQPFTPVSAAAGTLRVISALADPTQRFSAEGGEEDEGEEELSMRVDLTRRVELGPITSVKIGGFARTVDQSQRLNSVTLVGTNVAALNNSVYNFSSLKGRTDFYYGRLGQFDPADRPELDNQLITRLLAPNPSAGAIADGYIGPYGFLYQPQLGNAFDNRQDVYGGYGMVTFDGEITPLIRLRGNAGVRHERTSRSTLRSLEPPTVDFDYENTLPSINLAFELGGKVIIRTSYTETLRRPEVDSFAVGRGTTFAAGGVSIQLGASQLRPFISRNIDIGVEWYNRKGSVLSANFFRKNVIDFAAARRFCPENGGDFGFGPLSNATGLCRTTEVRLAQGVFPNLPIGTLVTISQTANEDEFTLKGFELTAQQNLDFLPAPWNGFGGQLNYTNVRFETDSTFRISEISKHTFNAILYYETKLFGLRAAYNYRSQYFLGSAGTFTGADRFVKARPQLDFSGQFNINDRLTLTAEAFNVTNEDLIEYEGVEERVRSYQTFGRTYALGLRYRFK